MWENVVTFWLHDDYVLVPSARLEQAVAALQQKFAGFGTGGNPSLTPEDADHTIGFILQ